MSTDIEDRFAMIELDPLPAKPVDPTLARITELRTAMMACTTYEALAALHPTLTREPEKIRAALREDFGTIRDGLLAAKRRIEGLGSLWQGLWKPLAEVIYRGMGGEVPYLVKPIEVKPAPEPEPVSWAPYFKVQGQWGTNAQRFATREEALDSARGRAMAWTAVDQYEARPTQDAVTYRVVDGRDERIVTLAERLWAVQDWAYKAFSGRWVATFQVQAEEAAKAREASEQARAQMQREEEARIEAELARRAAETRAVPAYVAPDGPSRSEVRQAFTSREIVAGAESEGSGVMVGWMGLGEFKRQDLIQALRDAGCPESWAPNAKSNHAHVGFALQQLNNRGHVIRADRGARRVGGRMLCSDGIYRTFQARWVVGSARMNGTTVGEAFGTVVLTATLCSGGYLDLVGEEALATQVREDYLRRSNEEVYPAAEITMWLRATLLQHCGAVRMGGVWYVPKRHAATASRLCERLAQVWGQDWIVPALPVSTTDQLCQGLARGLVEEAKEVLADLASQRKQALSAGKKEIGTAAAVTMIGRLKMIADRTKSYGDLMGSKYVLQVRQELLTAIGEIEPICDDTSARYAAIELS